MKLNGVSLSKYSLKVRLYDYAKLDLFEYIFVRIILNDSLHDKKLVECLNDLEINDDLFYLYENIYYKFVDNKVIELVNKEFKDILVSDIIINPLFKEALENNYCPVFKEQVDKSFIYDYYKEAIVVDEIKQDDSNIFVLKVDNSLEKVNELVNKYKRELFGIVDGVCLVSEFIADPYYFSIDLREENNKYITKNKIVSDSIKDNAFIVSKDDSIKGELLTNNIYFDCLYGDNKFKSLCKWLVINKKDKEYEVDGNTIYVDYDLEDKIVDLVNKETYHLGYYYINEEMVTTFYTSKNSKVSSFKLYLIKNKEKFKKDISELIEMI